MATGRGGGARYGLPQWFLPGRGNPWIVTHENHALRDWNIPWGIKMPDIYCEYFIGAKSKIPLP
jgi:hypothetical protein